MRRERMVHLFCVLAAIGLAWSPGMAAADLIWGEDFSSHPNMSSGNWHSNITTSGDSASIGTWSTSGGYAGANTSPSGSVSYTSANAQYMFTSAEKAAFGGLYDSASGTVGGGSVSSSLYVRFDSGIVTSQDGTYNQGFGWFQLRRGSTTTVEDLNNGNSGNDALDLGKEWGHTYFSGLVATPGVGDGFTHFAANPGTVSHATQTFVMRIDYAAGAADSLTIYHNPIVASENGQPSGLITTLASVGDLSFDSFLLRCGNKGTNWNFDNVKFGTSFADMGFPAPEPSALTLAVLGILGLLAYAWRKRK